MTEKYINRHLIYVDSHTKKANETHNNFTITANIPKEVDTVCVLRATIKKSYYLVQDGQNIFTLKEGSVNKQITVPIGNYSASSFRLVLEGLLNSNSPTSWAYTVTLPNTAVAASTGKFTYNCVGGNPSFIFTVYLYEQFGFDKNTTNDFINNTLTSANVVSFQLQDVLRIHSNIVNDSNNDILQEVSAISNDFGSLKYECSDIEANSKPFSIKTNTFSFKILDEEEQPINLSLNVLITLLFYRKNTTADQANKITLDWIKYQMLKK